MPNTSLTIRILFYCDDADQNWVPIDARASTQKETHDDSAHRGGEHEFGLGILKTLLEKRQDISILTAIQYEISVVNRNYSYNNTGYVDQALSEDNLNFITPELLAPFSQIWIFGMHYGNNLNPDPNHTEVAKRAKIDDWQRRSKQELTDEELRVLAEWMDAGNGVLITGDHSNEVNSLKLNLGRALGKHIKRAGELRFWEDGPLFNGPTHVDTTHNMRGEPDPNMETMHQQEDTIPQNIHFQWGLKLPGQTPPQPHMLFQTRRSTAGSSGTIRFLPDHVHEGAIKIPVDYTQTDKEGKPIWPSKNGLQPRPEMIAWGTNYALPGPSTISRTVGLVAAYDGHSVGVGNIVAHSTWHHFVNVNLVGFLVGTQPTDTLQLIGDYLSNLAVYLHNPKQLNILEVLALHLGNIPSPISDDPSWGGSNSGKNPLPHSSIFAKEVGDFAFQQLSRFISPVHLNYFIRDKIHTTILGHDASLEASTALDSRTVLGEMLLALDGWPVRSNESDSYQSSLAVEKKGILRALQSYLAKQEETLNPIRQAIVSMQR